MTTLAYRPATPGDIGFIVRLIVDDSVVATDDRPDEPDHPRYVSALAAIAADPNQMVMIAEADGVAVGTLQLSFIPGLAALGAWRGLIEAVHISPDHRNRGFGSQMIRWAIDRCRDHGCSMVQLTSNKARLDAHRFYRRLGFSQSHEGFKLLL